MNCFALDEASLALSCGRQWARRDLARVPPTTNTNLGARKKEILSMRPLLRGGAVK